MFRAFLGDTHRFWVSLEIIVPVSSKTYHYPHSFATRAEALAFGQGVRWTLGDERKTNHKLFIYRRRESDGTPIDQEEVQ